MIFICRPISSIVFTNCKTNRSSDRAETGRTGFLRNIGKLVLRNIGNFLEKYWQICFEKYQQFFQKYWQLFEEILATILFLKCLSPIVAKSTAAQMIKMVSFSSFSSFNTNIEIKLNISLVQLFVFLLSTCLYFSRPLVCISLARLFVLLSSIFIFSVVDCLPRLS